MFYSIDEDTYEPTLENVMLNYMKCSTMMFGSKVRYGITYKIKSKSFNIYRRKYVHDYKVNVLKANLEGSISLNFDTLDMFLCSQIDKVLMYDSINFQYLGEIPITLLKTETREPN